MNIKEFLNEEVLSVLKNLGYEAQDALVLRSNRPELSDYQSNVAMPLAKMAHKSPREIATQIATELEKKDFIAKVSVDGPGFINMSLNAPLWDKAFKDILFKKKILENQTLVGDKKSTLNFYRPIRPVLCMWDTVAGRFSGILLRGCWRKSGMM